MNKKGRRVGADGEKSRKLLLKIAAEEFASNGFYPTKVSTIVKKAAVTQPTFYLYFKSKDAIFQELVDLFKSKLATLTRHSRLNSGLESTEVRERIENNLVAIFQLFARNEHVARIGFIVSDDAFKIKGQMAKQIEENLAAEVKDGYFHSNIELKTVAIAIVGVIEHLTVTKLWTGLKTPEELSKETTQLFLYGLSKK